MTQIMFTGHLVTLSSCHSRRKAELPWIHNIVWVDQRLDAFEQRPRRGVLLAHQPPELPADSVMFVEDAAVFERRARRGRPDTVVQTQRVMRVARRLIDHKTVVDHDSPREPVREMRSIAGVPLDKLFCDDALLGLIQPLDLVVGSDSISRAVQL